MVTNIQNLVIDKASKIIDIINIHLDENPACSHTLDEIYDDIVDKKSHWATNPATTETESTNSQGAMD